MGESGSSDIFLEIGHADEETIARMVTRLEFRDTDPNFSAWRDRYLTAIDPATAGAVLEVGAGTGVVAREVARRTSPTTRIVAEDPSAPLLAAGREHAHRAGLEGRIDFVEGDVHHLDHPDHSFDVVIAHTVFSHIADPARALAEMARVVRPGGSVVVFDGDIASWTFTHPDPELNGAVHDALLRTVAHNPLVMRRLPALAHSCGLRITGFDAHALAEAGQGSYWLSTADTYVPVAARAGRIDAGRSRGWLEWQHRASDSGEFFAVGNYYTFLLTPG